MKNVGEYLSKKKDYEAINRKSFKLAMENTEFANLFYRLNISEEIGLKYTSKLENTVSELSNCKNCPSLDKCKNKVNGCVNFPEKDGDYLVFSYVPCKYKKEVEKLASKVSFYETPKVLREAKMKDIYLDDKAREETLKYLKDFMKDFPNKKGIYLHGSFGSGKSYILNAVLNELSRKGSTCVSVYYPTLLKKLRDSFNSKSDKDNYKEIYDNLETCDVLLIDDIGAENNSAWARDEVLGGILQSRMDNDRITFFTSNLTLEELESHLSETSTSTDKVKSRRIIERIKYLSKPILLVGEDKRSKC